MTITPFLWGDEFLVNTTTVNNQTSPQIAVLANGNYVVTWQDRSGIGGDPDSSIKAQMYDTFGEPVGNEFLVNNETAGTQSSAVIAELVGGDFVIAWLDSSTSSVEFRLFNANGAPQGDQQTVFDNDLPQNVQVEGLSNGGFIVSWDFEIGASGEDIAVRRFDDSGFPLDAGNIIVTTAPGNQAEHDVTELASGSFVVVWEDRNPSPTDRDIKMQLFDAAGAMVGSEIMVNSLTAGDQINPSVATLSNGNFVVAWQGQNALSDGIKYRVFDASGTEVVGERSLSGAFRSNPEVEALDNGEFLITWEQFTDIKAQRIGSDGLPTGMTITVNSVTSGTQNAPQFVATDDGRVVVVWEDGSGSPDDPSGSAVRSQILSLNDDNFTGSAGDDVLMGNANVNVAHGYDGNDIIIGNGGDDRLHGGAGNDDIAGGQGADILFGGDDDDMLTGGGGIDVFDGGSGSDTIDYTNNSVDSIIDIAAGTAEFVGVFTETFTDVENFLLGTGDDIATGDASNNTFHGNDGNDTMDGGAGKDTASYAGAGSGVTVDLSIAGQQDTIGAGLDTLSSFENLTGSAFADTLTGDANDNIIDGGDGIDMIDGGDGDDVIATGFKADIVDGGAGIDTIDYSLSDFTQTINLTSNVNINGHANGDQLSNIENVMGSNTRKDDITGNLLDNVLDGQGGNDILRGGRGDDTMLGGDGRDALYGGKGADVHDGGDGRDWAKYNGSSAFVDIDLINGGTAGIALGDTYIDIENVRGTDFGDTIFANDEDNKVLAGMGDDIVNGRGGKDALQGNDGNDTIIGGTGNDTMRGQAGDDIFVYNAGDGVDKILDFDDFGNDQIDLSSFGFSSFADVQAIMSQIGSRVSIDFGGGDVLRLENTNLADMGADDFILSGGGAELPSVPKTISDELPMLDQDLIAAFMADNTVQSPITFSNEQGFAEIMTDDDTGNDWDGNLYIL